MNFSLERFFADFYQLADDERLAFWSRQTRTTRHISAAELPGALSDLIRRTSAEDVYVGLATQIPELREATRGSNETVTSLPGLFADIDFGSQKNSSKAYPPDESTALQLIESFEYLPYLIQRSGNGLHVLYAGEGPLRLRDRHERLHAQALSRAFHRKLAAHFRSAGFAIDNVSDLARVYRLPGSLNHKSNPPKKVEVLRYSPEHRLDWMRLQNEVKPPTDAEQPARYRRPADHHRIAKECSWYDEVTGEGAATASEPDWFAAASITGRTREGSTTFHDYSRKYSNYDPKEAEQKLKRAVSEAGPRTCASIRDLGNDHHCAACPHWGAITSPIQLGYGYDPGAHGPIPLGYTRQGEYVFLDQDRQILVAASPQQLLSHQFLMGLAPSSFWAAQFPHPKQAFNSIAAGERLIGDCKSAGAFSASRVRGRGIWRERDNIVVNLTGDLVESTDFLYLCFEPLPVEATPSFDTLRLSQLLEKLPWRHPQDAVLALGWLALAPICGVLQWRPHLFVYGPPNSGKTTLHRLASAILRPLVVSADGQSSEAGIRQTIGPDSLPVVIDEFETDQKQGRLSGIVRLARSASSAETAVLRGTPEGKAMQFSLRTMFFMSAINVVGMTPADESRILVLELTSHHGDLAIGRLIEAEMTHFLGLGPTWAGYMVSLASHIAPAIDSLREHMPNFDSRHRQNMATLLAGAFVALHGRAPTTDEARSWAAAHATSVTRLGAASERDDAMEALEHLLAHPVRGSDGYDMPIGHWLGNELRALRNGHRPNAVGEHTRIVANHDIKIRIEGPEPGWFVRNGSPAIDRIFEGTRWAAGSWKRALGQIKGAFTPAAPLHFTSTSKKHRAVGLPLELIPEPDVIDEPDPPF